MLLCSIHATHSTAGQCSKLPPTGQESHLSQSVRRARGAMVRCAAEAVLKHDLSVIACAGIDGTKAGPALTVMLAS